MHKIVSRNFQEYLMQEQDKKPQQKRAIQIARAYLFREFDGGPIRRANPSSASTRRMSRSSSDDETTSPCSRLSDRPFFMISSKCSRRFCTPSGSMKRDSRCCLSARLRRLEFRFAMNCICASTRCMSRSSSDDDTGSPRNFLNLRCSCIIFCMCLRRCSTPSASSDTFCKAF